jgi:hypothetical protein
MTTLDDDVEVQQAAAKTKADNDSRTMVDDIKWLMSSPRGRRLVWWMLSITGVFRTSFNASGSVTFFNEGSRNIGLQLLAKVQEHCIDRYVEMLAEQRTK